MQVSTSVQAAIQQKLSERFSPVHQLHFTSIGGGSINETYRISFNDKNLFCKTNSSSTFPQLFQKEKEGLETIAKTGVIKTPLSLDCFEEGDKQILLLEWIHSGERTETFWKTFGEQLAALHLVPSDYFG